MKRPESFSDLLWRHPTGWMWLCMSVLAYLLVGFVTANPHYLGSTDPDAWLRLSELRDLMRGGGWFDHRVERDNAPYGVEIHWTRPFDLLLMLFAWPLSLFMPLDAAILSAASLVNPILFLLSMLGLLRLLWLMRPPAGEEAMLIALGLLLTAPYWATTFAWMRSDHHGLLALCAIWTVERAAGGRMRMAALIAVIGVWTSPELLIGLAAVCAAETADWVLRGKEAALRRLQTYLSHAAFFALLALFVERPPALWGRADFDNFSIVYIVLLAFAAFGAMALQRLPRTSWPIRLGSGLLVTIFAAAALLALFPDLRHGPMAGVHPFMFQQFFPMVRELQPGLDWDTPLLTLAWLLPGLVGLAAGCWQLYRRWNAATLALLAWLGIGMLAFAAELRWNYYLWPPLALLNGLAFDSTMRLARGRGWHLKRWRPLIVVGWALAPFLLIGLQPAGSAENAGSRAAKACVESLMAAVQSGALEQALGGQELIVAAPSDLGPSLLFWTPYGSIGSNYHRNGLGYRDAWHLWNTADEGVVDEIIARRGVDAWLWCDSEPPRIARAGLPGRLRAVPLNTGGDLAPLTLAVPLP